MQSSLPLQARGLHHLTRVEGAWNQYELHKPTVSRVQEARWKLVWSLSAADGFTRSLMWSMSGRLHVFLALILFSDASLMQFLYSSATCTG